MILLITYQIKNFTNDYTPLHEEIKKAGIWWHHISNVWMISTHQSPKEWYERLAKFLGPEDFIFITAIKPNYFGYLPKEAWDWTKQVLDHPGNA